MSTGPDLGYNSLTWIDLFTFLAANLAKIYMWKDVWVVYRIDTKLAPQIWTKVKGTSHREQTVPALVIE